MKNDSNDPLLQEIRDRRIYASTEWDDIQIEAKKDRLCVAGKPWDALDPEGKKQRDAAKRPLLALDEIGQYINQTVNDVRANPRGIKFAPTGNGANDPGAEFYQNHTREIEYRSKATLAYSTAFDNSVTGSYGWLRIQAKRQHVRTFDKDLWIDPVVNADQVLADPNAIWPDSRDMKYLFYIEPWPKAEFVRKFPKAKVKDFNAGWKSIAKQWIDGDLVHVAEYWKIESVPKTLVAFQRRGMGPNGQPHPIETALRDELPDGKLPPGAVLKREEAVDDQRVKCYLTNGMEILEETPWKGKHIPFVSCLGKIIYVDNGSGAKRMILSMTRLMRDPYMLYCYYRTCEAELVGMTPKFPYFVRRGSLLPLELANLQKSLHEPVAVIQVEGAMSDGSVDRPEFPMRNPYEPPIQELDFGAESARRAIQSAAGISPLPTSMQRDQKLSGKAQERLESSGQRGSFHFVDHYDLMVERTGVIIEDLIDKTIDTMRDVPVRKPDDSADIMHVNDPRDPESVFTKGDYRVTVSTGPASESQRQDGADFVDSMVSNIGEIAQLAGPQKALALMAESIKLKQLGPIGDAIAKLLSPPPQMGQDGKPVPPEVQQLQGQLQQMQGQLQQAGEIIKTDQVKYAAQYKIESMKADKEASMKLLMQRRELAAKIEETRIAAAKQAADLTQEAVEERFALALDSIDQAKDRQHELNMAQHGAQADAAQSDQDHQETLAQGDQQHDNALEQGGQAVAGQLAVQAAAPQPAAGAGA